MAKSKENQAGDVSEPGGAAGQDEALRAAGMTLPGDPRVWQVEIPNCLLGKKFIVAASEAEALAKYTEPCGITAYSQVPIISVMPFGPDNLPEGVELYGE